MQQVLRWLTAIAPAPVGGNRRDYVYGTLGALLGLLCTEWVGRHALGTASPWFIAPMGASAVLLFAAPASPLARPWSIVGGNVVSALAGVTCSLALGHSPLAAACAASLAIAAMFSLRCLHPPGGAVALTAVLGGADIAHLGYAYALWPVGINSIVLLCIGIVFNDVLKRQYLRRPTPAATAEHRTRDPAPSARLGLTPADLDAALAARGQYLDVDRDDLVDILLEAESRASHRRFGLRRCGEIMSRDVISVKLDDTLSSALRLFEWHRLQELPVVDEAGQLAGTLTLADALKNQYRRTPVAALPGPAPAEPKARDYIRTQPAFATPDLPVVALARPMADGLHCVPVVDANQKLVGLISQSDMVGALLQMTLAEDDQAAKQAA